MDTIHLETSLGAYLRQLRQARGQTLDEVAGKVGIKITYLSMLELNQRIPSIELAYSLAGYYGVSALNLLAMMNTLPDRFINDLKEQVKELLTVERLRNMVAVVMGGKCRVMPAGEILDYLAVNHPENFRIIHSRMIEHFPELQELTPKEAILAGLEKDISPGEALVLNETLSPSLPNLEPPEVIKAVKEELDLTWQQVGGLLGVSGREPPRWVNREVPIPDKVVRRLELLASKIMPRVEADIRPVAKITLGSNALSLGVIFAEIEELGLAEEIKGRFIKNEPDMERFRNRPLTEFFIERAKRKLTTREILKAEFRGRRRGAKKNDVLRGLYRQRMATEARWHFPVRAQAKKVNQAKTMRSKMPVSAKRIGGAGRGQGQKYKKGAASRKESGSDSDSGADGEPPGPEGEKTIEGVRTPGLTRSASEDLDRVIRPAANSKKKSSRRREINLNMRKGSGYWQVSKYIHAIRFQFRRSTGKTNKGEAYLEGMRLLGSLLSGQNMANWKTGQFSSSLNPSFKEMTLGHLADEYLKKIVRNPNTRKRYQISAQHLLEFFGKDCKLNEITTPRLMDFKDWRIKNSRRKLKPATLDRDMSFAKAIYKYAIEMDYYGSNPVKKLLFIREENGRTREMSEEEMAMLWQVLSAPGMEQLLYIFLISLYTLARRAEVVRLQKEDIDFKNGTIFFKTTKNGTPNTVFINNILFPRLKKYIEEKNFAPTDRLFPDLTPDKVTDTFGRMVRRLGIKNLIFNDLRRTASSSMKNNGVDCYMIDKIMNHKNSSITDRYINPSVDKLREAVNKITVGKKLLEGG